MSLAIDPNDWTPRQLGYISSVQSQLANMQAALDKVSPPLPTSAVVKDGSFEDNQLPDGTFWYNPTEGTPWKFDDFSGISSHPSEFTSGNPAPPEGKQVAFIQMGGTMNQTLYFPGGTYRVKFRAAQRANNNTSKQTLQVLIDSKVIYTLEPASINYDPYQTDPFSVTAGPHTLMFRGLNPNGGDNTAFGDSVAISPEA